MKIVNTNNPNPERQAQCLKGGFISNRVLLESDNMGYSLTITKIPKGNWQHWHYKNHLETCYCIQGKGILHDKKSKEYHLIFPGIVYILDNYDEHAFKAITDIILLCIFNPPLKGLETHKEDGSY